MAYCGKCGSYNEDHNKFCYNCGDQIEKVSTGSTYETKQFYNPYIDNQLRYNSQKYSPFTISGFIVSICALIIGQIGILGVVGLVLSIIGMNKTSGGKEKGKGLAIAGLVVGIVAIVVGVTNLIDLFYYGYDYYYYYDEGEYLATILTKVI